jgi:hypothetical protein
VGLTGALGASALGAILAPITAFLGITLYSQSTIVNDADELAMLAASQDEALKKAAAATAAAAAPPAVAAVEVVKPLMSKVQNEKEGDGTRGRTPAEIAEAFKDKLSAGQIKKLIEQVEKLRGLRNKSKDSRKK